MGIGLQQLLRCLHVAGENGNEKENGGSAAAEAFLKNSGKQERKRICMYIKTRLKHLNLLDNMIITDLIYIIHLSQLPGFNKNTCIESYIKLLYFSPIYITNKYNKIDYKQLYIYLGYTCETTDTLLDTYYPPKVFENYIVMKNNGGSINVQTLMKFILEQTRKNFLFVK